MIAELLALIFAAYALVSSLLGAWHGQAALVASGRRAVLVTAAFLLTAAASLAASFLTHDFGVRYVQEHSSRAMPWYYTLAAFYRGRQDARPLLAALSGALSLPAALLAPSRA